MQYDPTEFVMVRGFGAQFWVTTEPHIFLNWSPGGVSNLNPVDQVGRGVPRYFPIFFVNPGIRRAMQPTGETILLADVAYQIVILRPNGTIYSNSRERTGWDSIAPPARTTNLIANVPKLVLTQLDPAGIYTVIVFVRDRLRNVEIRMEKRFILKD